MSLSNQNDYKLNLKNHTDSGDIKRSQSFKQDVPGQEKQPEDLDAKSQNNDNDDSFLTENGERQAEHNYKIYLEYLKLTESVINRNFGLQAHNAKQTLVMLKEEIAESIERQDKEITEMFLKLKEDNRREKLNLIQKIDNHYQHIEQFKIQFDMDGAMQQIGSVPQDMTMIESDAARVSQVQESMFLNVLNSNYNQMLKLNLRGQELSVNRNILTHVKGSQLYEIFSDLEKVPNQ